ncbi:MAG TPA: hypothetical protein ENK23_01690 [Sorangium sp.]|nr:hypothetical protein [Sorangium sp.]
MRRWYKIVGGSAALLLPALVLGAGCSGSDLQTLCDEAVSCHDGNDQDVEACLVVARREEELQVELGCGAEHDAYTACFVDRVKCSTSLTGSDCQTDADCSVGTCNSANKCERPTFALEDDDCEAERNAFERCGKL